MFRTVASRTSYVALNSARPMVMVPMRFASTQNKGSTWETAKQEGSDLLGSVKNVGKAWAQDVGKHTENQIHVRQTSTKDTAAKVTGKAQEASSEIKEKAQEGAQWAKEKAQEGTEWAKSNTGEMKEKAQEGADWAKGKAQEVSSEIKEKISELKSAAPSGETIIEKAKEMAQKTYETVAPVASKAYENVLKPAAGKAYEFAKEQGAALYEKGKETASNIGSGIFEKTEGAASTLKEKAGNVAHDAKQTASSAASGFKEKITPKDQDQPKTSIPGQSRKINIEGEKPFAENEAAQWDNSAFESSIQGTKDPRTNKTL